MADGARFRNLQEAQNKLAHLLQIEITKRKAAGMKIQEHISGTDKKLDHLTQTLAEIQLQLLQLGKKHVSSEDSSLLRLDFPRFDGSNPRAWILQCNNYFKLMPSISDAQRINSAIMHFDGKALTWFQSLNMVEIRITWKQFLEVVCARFEVLPVSNIIVELNKLKQNGSYEDYVERFEELRAYIVLNDSRYSEDYFVTSFLSGLSEELRAFINMFQPRTLQQAIVLGKKQLITLDVISKKMQPPDAEDEMFEAQKAMKLGFSEVEINLTQIVQDSIHPMVGEEGLITMSAVGMIEDHHMNIPFSPRLHKVEGYDLSLGRDWFKPYPPIELGYTNMNFAVFLNRKKVKLKLLTTAVEPSNRETEASGEGIGVVIMQYQKPITYMRLKRSFYWSGMKSVVGQLVMKWVCQKNKSPSGATPSLFQSLPIPHKACTYFSMNLFKGLPKFGGKYVMLVMIGGSWKEFFKFMKLPSHHSLVYFPQIDEPTMRFNQGQDTYMCCKVSLNLRQSQKWLQATFGFYPLHLSLDAYLKFLNTETSTLMIQLQKLVQPLTVKRKEEEYYKNVGVFEVGDMLYLQLKSLCQFSVSWCQYLNPSSRLYELYRISEKRGVSTAVGASVLGTCVITEKIDMIFQSYAEGIQSEIMLVAESGVASINGKKYIIVQKLLEAVVPRCFKIVPLSVPDYRCVIRERQVFLQTCAHGLKIEPQVIIWKGLQHILHRFQFSDPWGQGSLHRGGIVMDRERLKLKEGKEELKIEIEFNSVKKMKKSKKKSKKEKLGLEILLGHMHYFELGHWLCLFSLGLV